MFIRKILCTALFPFILPSNMDTGYAEISIAPSIIVKKYELDDKRLRLCYEIKNDTKHDLWFFEGTGDYDISAEVFMEEDKQTLLIKSRLDIPASRQSTIPDYEGRYIRITPGRSISESISLPIPVFPYYAYGKWLKKPGLQYARRLAVEIGYYVGDLREIISSRLTKEKMSSDQPQLSFSDNPQKLIEYFGETAVPTFNRLSEGLRSRDYEVIIPYTDRLLKGERSLRIEIDGLSIPYEEKQDRSTLNFKLPDLSSCTKIDINYKPSMIEYFFPYDDQRDLLSPKETHYLRTVRNIVLEDKKDIEAIIKDIGNSVAYQYRVIRERTTACVTCYDGSKRLISVPIFNSEDFHLEDSDLCVFTNKDGFQSLKKVTPQIQLIQLRVHCAANLKDNWNRFQLYQDAEKVRIENASSNNKVIYPQQAIWCDAIILAYKNIGMLDRSIIKTFTCPATSESKKCHYAMNPNCEPNSPGDMVLLFETKPGWNQHGGPELFTFENHDPKGGCVLLNNGTVKFIRTKEELQQLRWK